MMWKRGRCYPWREGGDPLIFAYGKKGMTRKINQAMPQRLAKFVGTHSLKGRMLAGAIFDKMVEEGKTTPQEWRDNKVLHEKFYEELARAEKMPREKALKQYIPNTPVNRKRVVGMGMEEKGIENTPENFKSLYRQMREQGIFEKMLAKPEAARTTFSSRLLVETARRKLSKRKGDEVEESTVAKIEKHKAEVRKNSANKKRAAEKKLPDTERD